MVVYIYDTMTYINVSTIYIKQKIQKKKRNNFLKIEKNNLYKY
jgi:hypothetical protein